MRKISWSSVIQSPPILVFPPKNFPFSRVSWVLQNGAKILIFWGLLDGKDCSWCREAMLKVWFQSYFIGQISYKAWKVKSCGKQTSKKVQLASEHVLICLFKWYFWIQKDDEILILPFFLLSPPPSSLQSSTACLCNSACGRTRGA